MRRPLILVLGVVLGVAFLLPASLTARADGAWLDAPLQTWNTPGAAIPFAAPPDQAANPACATTGRPAETAEDLAVTDAGWMLVGSYQGGWGVKVITGASAADGMCRPLGFQVFVFVGEQYAGTLSPLLMDARTDGVVARVDIQPGGTELLASFSRYAATDPLCCPSSTSVVDYRLDSADGVPVLVPVSVFTQPNGQE